eukprot:TRINITY_DN5708_c0_g1_i2.p1 TRINITY_DN5708_c0_g1~~TRINITY_DN5708_c0_g1_i2.p1  ORF type:complete len:140 (+),score=32.95 TRINITY_DN5708_c0_g1_i2:964-1383(+)
MDNVLIDDRRIHVDFCQSLANKARSQRDRGNNFEEDDAMKQEYGLVFDNMELLQQAMRKKAKEARSRNANKFDEGEKIKRRGKKSPARSPSPLHKSRRLHSPDYHRDNRHYSSHKHSHKHHSKSTHHKSKSGHKHRSEK